MDQRQHTKSPTRLKSPQHWGDLGGLSPATGLRLVFAIAFVYFVVFSIMSSLKYQWFGQGHDLVLHEQAIWNTTQGHIFAVTGFVRPSRLFGYDPYLIELLVVPIYALVPTVFTLFVIQSFAIAAGAPAVWLIARDEGLPTLAGLATVLLYFAHPTVQYTNLDAFRERSLGLCFFLWAMWAFRRDRWRLFLLFLVLLIICRLEAALFASCFGLYAALKGRQRRYIVAPLVLGLGYFFIGNFVFVPFVNAGEPVSYVYEYFYPLGNTMGEVIRTVITDPIYTIQTTYTTAKVVYLVLLLLPTAGLALLAPRELVFTLPIIGLNLLATKPELTNIRYWYSMLLVGPLVVATIVGLRRAQGWLGRIGRPGLVWLPVIALLGCLVVAQLFPRNPVVSLWLYHEPDHRLATANAIVAMIPDDTRVAASSRVAPHLLRRYLYYYPLADPSILPTIDYIVADISSNSFVDPPSRAQLETARTSPDWELVLDRDGYQVFKRRSGQP